MSFDVIKTTELIRTIIENVLNTNEYKKENIDQWTRQIVDLCQRSLVDLQQSFRTIVSAMIVAKRDEYVHMSNGCLWEFEVDGSTIVQLDNDNEDDDELFSMDFVDIDIPFDLFTDDQDTTLFEDFIEKSNSNLEQISTISSSTSIDDKQPPVIPNASVSLDFKPQHTITLSFINPPEPFYHVRYLSEIANSSLNDNLVNSKMKTKKNVSGRYLKGTHGRYITIALPSILSENVNLYIRVTRLTVPFPHLILTRLKQCHLKHINNLIAFDNNELSYPFDGMNAKTKIVRYQLKKSQLDFRLVIRCEQTETFLNTDIFCRSNALLEEEGVEWKKSLSL
ncbi:hypothetical protein I4U23_012816 [Adineta vaga]|nr:hypothetical protein I4U23_012816 [Adineta vaga]